MESSLAPLASLLLVFVLGLRHGFDPDHIAVIDGMVYSGLSERPAVAPWIGTLFALGHGLMLTVITVVLGVYVAPASIPGAVVTVLAWMPVLLMVAIGCANLRNLLGARPYQASGWKLRFVPRCVRSSSHPLAVFAVGVFFALVFDTATQAAAWGAAANARSGPLLPLMIGLSFTAGMVLTDSIDSRIMVRMLARLSDRSQALAYRRKVGWIIVTMSFGIALYSAVTLFLPDAEPGDTAMSVAGLAANAPASVSPPTVIR